MIKKVNYLTTVVPVFFFLLILFLLSRLQNLTSIPVFADEAIYIRWSQIIKSVETLRFIPLTDGKQPLFMWLTVPAFKLVSDPLFAGRLISVFAGLCILPCLALTTFFITRSYLAPLISVVVYLTIPFAFFFDRLALADNLLSFWAILSLFLSLLQAKYLRLDLGMILGSVLGLAYLTKSPALELIVLSFFTVLILNLRPKFPSRHRLALSIVLPLITSAIAIFIYNILRLGPQFHMIAIRNRDYIWPLSEILRHPLDPLQPHLIDVLHLYSWGIGLPLFLLSIVGLYLLARKRKLSLSIAVVALWWFLPLCATASLAKVFTARYILFTIPPLIVLFSVFINEIFLSFPKFQHIATLALLLATIPNLVQMIQLSVNPFNYRLPSTETGYLQNWTAGWGIKETADFLITRSQTANIIIGTEGYFGTLPDGLQIYLNQLPRLTVIGSGVNITEIPANLIDAKNHGDEVYLLLNHSRNFLPPSVLSQLEIVKSFPKPDNDSLELIRI